MNNSYSPASTEAVKIDSLHADPTMLESELRCHSSAANPKLDLDTRLLSLDRKKWG